MSEENSQTPITNGRPDANSRPEVPRGPELVFAGLAREITELCLHEGKDLFREWEVPVLFRYVFFHLATRSCVFLRKNGRPVAVLFAWGMPAGVIEARAAASEPVFTWQLPDDQADALFLAEVVATDASLPALLRRAGARWPNLQARQIYTFRHGRLVKFTEAVKERFLNYGRR